MAIADQGKKKEVAVSQRAIGFRFLMQRYYILIWRMLMFAHVCSYGAGRWKGSCLVITERGIQMGTEWGSQLVTDCGIQLGTE